MVDKENIVNIYKGIFSAINNKIMSSVGKWMKLEIAILSESSQIQKHKYLLSHL